MNRCIFPDVDKSKIRVGIFWLCFNFKYPSFLCEKRVAVAFVGVTTTSKSIGSTSIFTIQKLFVAHYNYSSNSTQIHDDATTAVTTTDESQYKIPCTFCDCLLLLHTVGDGIYSDVNIIIVILIITIRTNQTIASIPPLTCTTTSIEGTIHGRIFFFLLFLLFIIIIIIHVNYHYHHDRT